MEGRSRARPNVVFLLADDLGYGDLSLYGCPDIHTPNIDSIGKQGVRFTRCYANAPECTPTRTALLTGRYQQRVGGLESAIGVGNVGRYDEAEWLRRRGELGLPSTEVTLSKVLKGSGYDTACFGKWHLGYPQKFWPFRHGFDESFGVIGGREDYFTHCEPHGRNVMFKNNKFVERKGYMTDLIADACVEWLARRDRNPFFLYVPFTAPHAPLQDPDEYDPVVGTAPIRDGNRQVYARMVERMDDAVGAILAQLDRLGIAENTLVIFTSDNGANRNGRNDPFRGGKASLWEGGIRVPAVWRWPSAFSGNRVTEQVATTFDWTRTILTAADGNATAIKWDGIDLLPFAGAECMRVQRTLFWRTRHGPRTKRAVLRGDMKLVMTDDGGEQLYDLSKDPQETNNLRAKAVRAGDDLVRRLSQWETEVRATRLRGFHSNATQRAESHSLSRKHGGSR